MRYSTYWAHNESSYSIISVGSAQTILLSAYPIDYDYEEILTPIDVPIEDDLTDMQAHLV